MSIQGSQVYMLRNVKSGTVMDLSGVDNTSVIGYPSHGGTNQQWRIEWTGNSWTFRSISSGLYLSLDGAPANGTRIVATNTPAQWHIWQDDVDKTAFRVYMPFTRFNLDLFNRGDPTPGTPITLWYSWNGIHQTWRFEQV